MGRTAYLVAYLGTGHRRAEEILGIQNECGRLPREEAGLLRTRRNGKLRLAVGGDTHGGVGALLAPREHKAPRPECELLW